MHGLMRNQLQSVFCSNGKISHRLNCQLKNSRYENILEKDWLVDTARMNNLLRVYLGTEFDFEVNSVMHWCNIIWHRMKLE